MEPHTSRSSLVDNSNPTEARDECVDIGECPNAHGPLKEWGGKMRCWECGWTSESSEFFLLVRMGEKKIGPLAVPSLASIVGGLETVENVGIRSTSDPTWVPLEEAGALFPDLVSGGVIVLPSNHGEIRAKYRERAATQFAKAKAKAKEERQQGTRSFIEFVVLVIIFIGGVLIWVSNVDIGSYVSFRGPAGIFTVLLLAVLWFKLSAMIAGILVKALISSTQSDNNKNDSH